MSVNSILSFSSTHHECEKERQAMVIPTRWRWALAVASVFGALLVAQAWKVTTTEQLRRQSSTQTRLLLSFQDTNTGLMEVRGINNEVYFASPMACSILGYVDSELNGISINQILPKEFRAFHQDRLMQAMKSVSAGDKKSHVSTMQCTAISKDGKPVDITIRVLVSKNGIFALINRSEEISYFVMPKDK